LTGSTESGYYGIPDNIDSVKRTLKKIAKERKEKKNIQESGESQAR
jgi:hypothetical protein